MSKFVIIALCVAFTVVNARGITAENHDINHNELASIEKESRVLLEVPLIGTLVIKSLKLVWYLLSTFITIFDYKLTAIALAVNGLYYLYINCYPVIIGAVLMFKFCKLTGLCGHKHIGPAVDPLAYAADYLYLGGLKYGDDGDSLLQ